MNKLVSRDRACVWHPFEYQDTASVPIPIVRGEGSYVYDAEGRAYLDLISSWWVNLHGHAHPLLAEAIYKQAQTLEHVIFSGFTHEPAVVLAEQLMAIVPSTLKRVFYSDNGSTAVEVALKMAVQYWHEQHQTQRTLFLSFEGGYHGDTFGAMAVGASSGYHDPFRSLLFQVHTIPFVSTWDDDKTVSEREEASLTQLELVLSEHADRIAALILEPLVQGSSGMRMCRPAWLHEVIVRVKARGILIIFDEVMTGFGRTGTLLALDQLNETPDLLCLSKGLTGGCLPLSVTITTEALYQTFMQSASRYRFSHGHSYTANPLACAAAITSIQLLQTPESQHAREAIHQAHRRGLETLKPWVQHPRVMGTIAAFEIENESACTIRTVWVPYFLSQGLLLRPLGKTIYLLPPYSTSEAMLMHAYACLQTWLSRKKVRDRL